MKKKEKADIDCGQYSYQTVIEPHGKSRKSRKSNAIKVLSFISIVLLLFLAIILFNSELQKRVLLTFIIGVIMSFLFITIEFIDICQSKDKDEIKKSNKTSKPIILILLGVFAFATINMNAQNPSETQYMREIILNSFHVETSFLDQLTGIENFSELYGIEGSEIKMGITTIVLPKNKGNFLCISLFDEKHLEPFAEKILSFDELDRIYRNSTEVVFWESFSISIPKGDNTFIPGEYILIKGEVFNEGGGKCSFEIEYHAENLWFKRKTIWDGYPQPTEYKYSKIGSANCEVTKLPNTSLYYDY